MYQEFVKLTQESLKPMMQLAEKNTALTVDMLKSQSEKAAELLESNLSHFLVLSQAKDFNGAAQLQQKYVETLSEKIVTASKENAAALKVALDEAGKAFEGSLAEVQAHAKKTAEKVEKEMTKAAKKAA